MKNEDKELLLKDLCSRLPYGVMCTTVTGSPARKLIQIATNLSFGVSLSNGEYMPSIYPIDEVKPYLRSLSSMTEEEMERLIDTHSLLSANGIPNNVCCTVEGMDYLNSIHVDYRGLIEKGLALEAPEGMYK